VHFNAKYIDEERSHLIQQVVGIEQLCIIILQELMYLEPLYLPTGDYSEISYVPMLQGGNEDIDDKTVILTLGTSIEPISGWETRVNFNYKNASTEIADNKATVLGPRPDGTTRAYAYPQSSFTASFADEEYYMINSVSNYTQSLRSHNINLMVGFEHEMNRTTGLWAERLDQVTSNVPSISTATGDQNLTDFRSHWSTLSFFGRANYNYDERYLFELNTRYDGSSRFLSEHRWGLFPSFSVGYNISREDYWSNIEPYINETEIESFMGFTWKS
jgi:hypothetical protein